MKNKHLSSLIFVLSGAMLLASCGGGNSLPSSSSEASETSSSSSEGDVVATNITISKAVTSFVVGDSIDLEKSTVCSPANAVWSVAVGSDAFTVDGHTVTCIAPTFGSKVTLTITSGTITKKYSISAISLEKSKINTILPTITKNYTSSVAIDTDIYGVTYHNANYFAYANYEPQYAGMIKADNGAYYNFDAADESFSSITVNPGKQHDFSNFYLGEPFSDYATADDFVDTKVGSTWTCTYSNSSNIRGLIINTTSLDFSSAISSLNAAFDKDDHLILSNTISVGGKAAVFAITFEDIGTTTLKACDDYIAAKSDPGVIDTTDLTTFFAGLSTTKLTKSTGKTAWLDYDGNALTGTDLSGMVTKWGLENWSTTEYTNAESLYDVDNGSTEISSLVKHEGAYYSVSSTVKDGATTYAAAAQTGITDIWGDGYVISSVFNATLFGKANCASKTANKDGSVVYEFNELGTDSGTLEAYVINSMPMYGGGLWNFIKTMKDTSGLMTWKNFVYQCTLTLDAAKTSLDASIIFFGFGALYQIDTVFSKTDTDMVPTDYLTNVTWSSSSAN